MKIVFLILTHKQLDNLFFNLLEWINKIPEAIIIQHHDFSQCDLDRLTIEKFGVHLVEPYHQTKWGHISQMSAINAAYKKAFEVEPDFDWLITLSANCFPIKSIEYILKFFNSAKCDYFMEAHALGNQYEGIYKWHYRTLFTKHLFSIPFFSRKGKFYKRAIRLPINKNKTPFKNIIPYTGSDWYFVNNKAARRILKADLPNNPLSFFLEVQNQAPDMNACPSEILTQTILKNQKDLIGTNKYFRYINWNNSKDWHPNTLTMDNWEEIQKTDALFARKFDSKISESLLENIRTYLLTDN